VVDADCVVVMQDGRVRATGSHQDLLRRDEVYREMIEQQNIGLG
jgi:ATP-binding cassette subfamily B multidrug efflux pump